MPIAVHTESVWRAVRCVAEEGNEKKNSLTFTTASVPTMCAREPTPTALPFLSFAFSQALTNFPRSVNLLAPSASANTTYVPLACLMPCVTAPPLPRFSSRLTTRMVPGRMFVGVPVPDQGPLYVGGVAS